MSDETKKFLSEWVSKVGFPMALAAYLLLSMASKIDDNTRLLERIAYNLETKK